MSILGGAMISVYCRINGLTTDWTWGGRLLCFTNLYCSLIGGINGLLIRGTLSFVVVRLEWRCGYRRHDNCPFVVGRLSLFD